MRSHVRREELERLAILAEECGEVQQAVGKILRFGYNSLYDNGMVNRDQLEIELGDVLAVIELMVNRQDVKLFSIEKAKKAKAKKLKKHTRYQY